ncbi:MAG TPA: putative ABC transporter permease [Candidatus Butyricicoccus stercorigallinarum]|nr:putative ABC transporter permease [Candidatus Butyricicoccus stercorigallinarum]
MSARISPTARGFCWKPYVLYFLLYAVLGWCYEVFLEVVVYRWGFSNRGVLFGPYCPVYGVGALLFLLCFSGLMRRRGGAAFRLARVLLVFLGCMAVATAVELISSYLLEWTIGSWPWQTYADYAWNFQARIALSPSVRFGLGGVLFLYLIQPLFERLVGRLSPRALDRCAYGALALLAVDFAATVLVQVLA